MLQNPFLQKKGNKILGFDIVRTFPHAQAVIHREGEVDKVKRNGLRALESGKGLRAELKYLDRARGPLPNRNLNPPGGEVRGKGLGGQGGRREHES